MRKNVSVIPAMLLNTWQDFHTTFTRFFHFACHRAELQSECPKTQGVIFPANLQYCTPSDSKFIWIRSIARSSGRDMLAEVKSKSIGYIEDRGNFDLLGTVNSWPLITRSTEIVMSITIPLSFDCRRKEYDATFGWFEWLQLRHPNDIKLRLMLACLQMSVGLIQQASTTLQVGILILILRREDFDYQSPL